MFLRVYPLPDLVYSLSRETFVLDHSKLLEKLNHR